MKRRVIWLLLALVMALSGCAEAKYEKGYREGYAEAMASKDAWYAEGYSDGIAAWPEPTEPPETTAPPVTEPVETEQPTQPKSPAQEAGFVDLSEALPEVILEVRYYTSYNFVGERIDGYEAPVALATAEAAEALKGVCADLEDQGYRLKIYDAYRPQQAVDHFKRWAGDPDDETMKEYFYPKVPKSELFDRGYISSRSGHSRGSTVDVSLVDMMTGVDVDMGSPFDFFGDISHAKQTKGLTEAQIANRAILRNAMERNGFKGISTEWWHFRLVKEPYPDTYFDFPVA